MKPIDNKTYCKCGHRELAHNWRTGCLVGGCDCMQFCEPQQVKEKKEQRDDESS